MQPAPPPISAKPRGRLDALVVTALALLLLLAIVAPQLKAVYPFTYDEMVYLRKTRDYDQWLREGLHQAALGQPLWLFSPEAVGRAEQLEDMHPGFVKLVGLVPHWLMLAALHRQGGARLTGAIFLALAACCLYWLLAPRTGRRLALLGALAFGFMPRLFGHAHFHALDVPVMAMMFVAALALRRAALTNRWRDAIIAALITGCALATKLNAVALVPQLALWLPLYRPSGWKKTLACSAVLSPLVAFALWPWLWHDLPGKLTRYLSFHTHHYNVDCYYLGHAYGGNTTAPMTYPLIIMAVTLPLAWLIFSLAGVAGAIRRREELPVFLLLGLAANLGLAMLPQAPRYGGERLFMPAFIFAGALAILAAHHWVVRRQQRTGRNPGVLALAAGLLLLLPNVIMTAAYYPYCLSYYSGLVGGLRGATRLGLEPTYWGDAFYGAAPTMAAPANAPSVFYASNELATGVLDAMIMTGMIPPQHRMLGRFVRDQIPADADWVIVDNSPAAWNPAIRALRKQVTPAVTVNCRGVPLLWLYKLR